MKVKHLSSDEHFVNVYTFQISAIFNTFNIHWCNLYCAISIINQLS